MRRFVCFLIFASMLTAASCRLGSPPESNAKTDADGEKVSNENRSLPFASKEPEKYQAKIVFAFRYDDSAPNFVEQTTFVARDGANRRVDFEIGDKRRVTTLATAEGKRFLLLPERKIYAEIDAAASPDLLSVGAPEDYSLAHLLHAKPPDAKFQKSGTETIDGKQLTKYTVDFGNVRETEDAATETVVWFDEQLNLPVKTEVTAFINKKPSGAKSIAEIRDFKTEVEPETFAVPADFRKVSPKEIQDIIKPK